MQKSSLGASALIITSSKFSTHRVIQSRRAGGYPSTVVSLAQERQRREDAAMKMRLTKKGLRFISDYECAAEFLLDYAQKIRRSIRVLNND